MLGWKPKKGIPVPVEPKTGAYWSQVKHTSHERCFFGPEINRRPSFLRLNSSESVASNIWIMLLCCCTSWSLAYQQNCDIGTKLRLNCSLSAPFQQAAALREMEKRGRTCSCCVYCNGTLLSIDWWCLLHFEWCNYSYCCSCYCCCCCGTATNAIQLLYHSDCYRNVRAVRKMASLFWCCVVFINMHRAWCGRPRGISDETELNLPLSFAVYYSCVLVRGRYLNNRSH